MFGDADGFDVSNYYRVIASGVSMNDPTLNVCESGIQQRSSAGAFRITNSVKPVLIFRGEASRYVLLFFGEDIDGEVLAFAEGFMNGRALVYARQHETWFERQRCEGAYGDSGWLTVLRQRRNHSHTAYKPAERGAKIILAYRHHATPTHYIFLYLSMSCCKPSLAPA